MEEAVRDRIEAGLVRLWCVDSVNGESWYNRNLTPRERVGRQVAYEKYVLEEVVPRIGAGNGGATRRQSGALRGQDLAGDLTWSRGLSP